MTDTTTRPELMAYVALYPACGCRVAATVDNPGHAHDTARNLAEWVRYGLTISRHTVEEVRAMDWTRCPHQNKPAKATATRQARLPGTEKGANG